MKNLLKMSDLTPGELTDVYLQEMRRDFPAGELKPLSMILTSAGTSGLCTHLWPAQQLR